MAVAGAVAVAVAALVVVYLVHINRLLSGTPDDVARLPEAWTLNQLKETYARLEKHPIDVLSYRDRLPPKLERRYIVTGGSGESTSTYLYLLHT